MNGIEHSLKLYANGRLETGGFLYAVLANDLMDAMGRADNQNAVQMRAICGAVQRIVPPHARGSRRAVADWLSSETAR